LNALNQSTVDADKDQSAINQFKHAESDGDIHQAPSEAKSLADAFVRKNLMEAKDLLAQGRMYEAYYRFGIGLHALQDATSPAHWGFQPWSDHLTEGQKWDHVKQELFYPGTGSNLQMITNKYLDWFENSNQPLPKENLFNNIQHD
jgi:hypothetical protein